MSFAEKLANVVNRHDEIQALLSSPDVSPDDLVRMNQGNFRTGAGGGSDS